MTRRQKYPEYPRAIINEKSGSFQTPGTKKDADPASKDPVRARKVR